MAHCKDRNICHTSGFISAIVSVLIVMMAILLVVSDYCYYLGIVSVITYYY